MRLPWAWAGLIFALGCEAPEPCEPPPAALMGLGGHPCDRSPELCGLAVESTAGSPTEARLDVVFVAEGFTTDELQSFHDAADSLITEVQSDILIRRRPSLFGYHKIALVSETNALSNGLTSDTALGGCLSRDTLGLSADWFLSATGNLEALASNVPGYDVLVVLFNTELGRANAAIGLATDRGLGAAHERTIRMSLRHDAKVLSHELGHVLFALGDEYADSDAEYVNESRYVTSTIDPLVDTPNLSLDSSGEKWRGIIEGARPGGRRYGAGIHHPTDHCRMLSSDADRFCPVCERRIEEVIAIFEDPSTNDGPPRCGIELDQPSDRVSGTFDVQLRGFDLNGVWMERFTLDGEELLPVTTATAACPPACRLYDTHLRHGFALGMFDGEALGPGAHEMRLLCADALGSTAESMLTIEVR